MAKVFPFQMPQGRQCPPKRPPLPLPKPPKRDTVQGSLTEKTDGDTLLLLAFLWLVSKENCDKKLLLALGYILL